MFFWLAIGFLTIATLIVVIWPLLRQPRLEIGEEADSQSNDVAVYKDQIAEIDRDLEGGLISETEAEGARAEIGRRLLQASKRGSAAIGFGGGTARWLAVSASVLISTAVAIGFYLQLGSPNADDEPLKDRLAGATKGLQGLQLQLARAKRRVATDPDDAEAHELLAAVYLRQGRYQDAATAFSNITRILGENEVRLSNQAEALVLLNNQLVTKDARLLFERAIKHNPKAVRPRYFIAMSLGQEGKSKEALAAWKSLLRGAKGGEPWARVAVSQIIELEKKLGLPSSIPKVGDMVAQIEKHLSMRPDDLRGWVLIAPIYFRMRRYEDAAIAYGHINRLDAGKPEHLIAQGQALVFAQKGVIGDPAKALFEKAVSLNAEATPAKAYLAIHAAQTDPNKANLDRVEAIAARATQEDVWLALARQTAAVVRKKLGMAPAVADAKPGSGGKGPTAADIAAAGKMSETDRGAMIEGMVEGLAERLSSEGGPAEEWVKLMRAYGVLGKPELAKATFTKALTVFADKPAELAFIKDQGAKMRLSP